jgi:hypothetical protein
MAIMNEFACFDFKEKLKSYALFIINCICSTDTSVMMTIGYKHVKGRSITGGYCSYNRQGAALPIGDKGSRGGSGGAEVQATLGNV